MRVSSLIAVPLVFAGIVLLPSEARACAVCVTAFTCDIDACEGFDGCSFDGPKVSIRADASCNFVQRIVGQCRAAVSVSVPSCRQTGDTCNSEIDECRDVIFEPKQPPVPEPTDGDGAPAAAIN